MRTTAALSLLLLAGPAAAQSVEELCATATNVSVGQWARYRLTMPQMDNEPMEMRMAIVGEEAVNGAPHYWFELNMAASQGTMIMQVLVPGWPYDADQVAGMIMKAGDQPAMRMPAQMMGMMAQRAPGGNVARDMLKECRNADIVGTERVTVPAGTFEAVHLRSTADGGADIWAAAAMPFGLIRMQGRAGEMVLLGHGTDATSSITETPRGM